MIGVFSFLWERKSQEKVTREWALRNEVVLESSREMLPEEAGVGPRTGFDRVSREQAAQRS